MAKKLTVKSDVIKNNYGCSPKLWKKWTDVQRLMYNNVRAIGKMENVSHPAAKISLIEWNTICHNFACLAAFEVKPK